MKKRKIKKSFKIILIILLILIFLLLSPYLFIDIKLIGDSKVIINYGSKYTESGYKAYIFNKNITKNLKITNNIKEELGKYKVIYEYDFLFYKVKKVRNVYVKDVSKPKIELIGGSDYEITVNTEYIEPGFKAIDNYDGDVTKLVSVENNIDIKKIGNYQVKYIIEDSSKNKLEVIRNVRVEKKRPTQMSVEEYTLDGWYDEVKLKETANYGEEYFNKITMIGDSNTMNMYLLGYLNGIRTWAIPCLHAESMHNIDINLYGLGLKMKLLDAIEEYKPETIILNFGTFSTTWISEKVFLEKANLMIEISKKKVQILILFLCHYTQ